MIVPAFSITAVTAVTFLTMIVAALLVTLMTAMTLNPHHDSRSSRCTGRCFRMDFRCRGQKQRHLRRNHRDRSIDFRSSTKDHPGNPEESCISSSGGKLRDYCGADRR